MGKEKTHVNVVVIGHVDSVSIFYIVKREIFSREREIVV
jgi:hypothetical protein